MIPHGPMERNLGIDTKIKSVALQAFCPPSLALLWPQMAKMTTQQTDLSGLFGHLWTN